jgi:hypothetical protein
MHPLAAIYRIWTATKAAVISLLMILLGAGVGYLGWHALRLGLSYFDWNRGITSGSNVIALLCVALALGLGAYGINKMFEAPPGITPRRITDAGGRSRLAKRSELRRDRII